MAMPTKSTRGRRIQIGFTASTVVYIYKNQFKNQRLRNFDHQFIKKSKTY